MDGSTEAITAAVRRQYEEFPYPQRDPADEKKRLARTALGNLDVINHYCYRGRRDFRRGFRVLVAGGGTGDATIYLAEQLRQTDATVVYVDLSAASMEIARQRAAVRGLENIRWVQGSLLDLPTMGLGEFDFIECSGVLHHLADPTAGLRVLVDSLAAGGAMFLMVYGRYGRTGVYQMQELMRLVNAGVEEPSAKVANTRKVLGSLPATNWFRRAEELFPDRHWESGAGIYDLFLHSRDRAYTVPELYEWLDSCRLELIQFAVEDRLLYRPETFLDDPELLGRIRQMPLRRQQAIGELLSGAIRKHSFLAAPRKETVASLRDLDNIPFFREEVVDPRLVAKILAGPEWVFSVPSRPNLTIRPGRYTRAAFKYVDGRRSLREILRLAGREFAVRPSRNDILAEFSAAFDAMLQWGDFVLLRHPSSRR